MPVVSIIFGLLLSALGGYGYSNAVEGHRSITALIPAFVGVPLIILGLVGLVESYLKHAMHAAAVLGLLGFLGGAINLVRVMMAGVQITELKAWVSAAMAGLCLVFVGFCVNSFIQARLRKQERERLEAAGEVVS
jgi:hypothetical protein